MSEIGEIPGFTVKVATEADRDDICSLVAVCFATQEPLTTHLKISEASVRNIIVEPAFVNSLERGLSLVVREKESGRIAAAMVNEDLHQTVNAPSCPVSEITPIIDFLEKLEGEYTEKEHPNLRPGQVFHAFAGATHKDFQGKGIATKLRAITARLAKSKGFSHLVVEATNPITFRIWGKLGGVESAVLDTKTHLGRDGSPIFDGIGVDQYSLCLFLFLRGSFDHP
eukprot:CAMPEP_0201474984 /NCGR_PEP_ID=MMETSP0151_2-20130828/480_1 /ASSEMBLY_ACC=CAM_ASM_000257 /TAXON_ID=200890 /ORGANISM="Paramoeba atlantica, Strain 621/1 / CCAP 1560/9" /LENGTH=225 /DNA_ID=CAMNT_0047854965 /DNA_START=18 /DNA_END=692 /DNA_ORIENTATION=+